MVRYTEVEVTPNADSLGFNTGDFTLADIYKLRSEGSLLAEVIDIVFGGASTTVERYYSLDTILSTKLI